MESTAEFETALSEWKCADAVVSVWRCAVAGAAESSAPEGRALAVLCDLTRDVLRFFADGAASLIEHRRTASDDDSGCSETAVAAAAAAAAAEVAADTARAAVRLLNGELARHALIEAEKTLRGELALHVPSAQVRTLLQQRCGGGAVWAEDASTIVAAAVEYILSEVCELSSTSAAVKKEDELAETPLSPRKIFLAIAGDEELATLFRNSAIAGSGVFPRIHPCYMPRARCVGDDDEEEAKEDPEDEEAIAEMREVQATGDLLIEEAGFREFANGVAAYVPEMKGHDLGDDALQVLQAAAEDFLQTRFRHTSLAAIHARRTVSNPEDMQLVQRLVEEREEEEDDDDEAMEDGSATCVPRAAFAALAEELVEAEWAVRTKASLPPTTSAEEASSAAATEEPLITDEAIAVLHEAAEAEMAEMMRSSLAIAEHGGRMSVFPKDIMLWRRITGACRHLW